MFNLKTQFRRMCEWKGYFCCGKKRKCCAKIVLNTRNWNKEMGKKGRKRKKKRNKNVNVFIFK